MTDWIAPIVVVVIGFAAVFLGDPLVEQLFKLAQRPKTNRSVNPKQEPVHAELVDAQTKFAAQTSPQTPYPGNQLQGGRWIGYLERLAVYIGVLLHYPETIAVVVAVKGLGRYPELRNSQDSAIAERFIIGTFASLIWSVSMVGLATWVTSLLP